MNQFIVRDIRNGDWYWVSRVILLEYAAQIGILALCIYHFLASMADVKQSCYPSQSYIAKYLGCSRGSVSRGIKTLRDFNLIAVETRSRYVRVYYLLNVASTLSEHQLPSAAPEDVQKTYTNNKRLIKVEKRNVSVPQLTSETSVDFLETLMPKTREELLAKDIADSLQDYQHLALYLEYAHIFPESLLRKVLSEVKQKPLHKIKKSRGALYTYLINKYGKRKLPDIDY